MIRSIPYKNIRYYSNLIVDYLATDEKLAATYNRFPSLSQFKEQLTEKKHSYPQDYRPILVDSLLNQYKNTKTSARTQSNLEALNHQNTFTVTTGHQLNLFTGPLYFLYKIISVINLTEELKKSYPDYHFVPVYWLASEDHDFEEIRFFNFKSEKIEWNTSQQGAVGRFSLTGMEEVFQAFKKLLNDSTHSLHLQKLFEEAYLNHANLTEATRYLANELFGRYGLVIIDGDDKNLKRLFIPQLKNELLKQSAHAHIVPTAKDLQDKGYKIQVNPREINLFYLSENSRNRIVKEEDLYLIHETEKSFTESEILKELENHPDNFSPNAIMRPLYQEVILPNLCYVGGSGELAYWLELKEYFNSEKITFPCLLLRNSALLLNEKQEKKCKRLGIKIDDLFLPLDQQHTIHTKNISSLKIDFTPQKKHLTDQFERLYQLAEKTDKSFYGAVAAQERKQIKGLEHLEKRLLKAQKRKLREELNRITQLYYELFPSGNLQERVANFSEFYESHGAQLIEVLFERLQPLNMEFDIIRLPE